MKVKIKENEPKVTKPPGKKNTNKEQVIDYYANAPLNSTKSVKYGKPR